MPRPTTSLSPSIMCRKETTTWSKSPRSQFSWGGQVLGSGSGSPTSGSGSTGLQSAGAFGVNVLQVVLPSDFRYASSDRNCLDLIRPKNSTCWNNLNMPAWITAWIRSSVTCAASADCTVAAAADSPWTTKFLTIIGQPDNSYCYHLSSTQCNLNSFAPTSSYVTQQLLYARYSYGAVAIYCNSFFFL